MKNLNHLKLQLLLSISAFSFVIGEESSSDGRTTSAIFNNSNTQSAVGIWLLPEVNLSSSFSRNFIQKCCDVNEVLEFDTEQLKLVCRLSGSKRWKPFLYTNTSKSSFIESNNGTYEIVYNLYEHFITNFSDFVTWPARDLSSLNPEWKKAHWRLLYNGTLVYLNNDLEWKSVDDKQNYCIDGFQNLYGNSSSYSGTEVDQLVLISSVSEVYDDYDLMWKSLFYATLAYIAAFFYLLSTIVYCILFSKSNSNGWTILGYVGSLFARSILIGTCHLIGHLDDNNEIKFTFNSWESWSIAVVSHFFALSSTFWIALMSFDLTRTIRSPTLTFKHGQFCKFLIYCCIGWGLPLLAVSFFAVLDHLFGDPESGIITPKYGVYNTFIDTSALGFYFYYIVSIIMLINFIFIITAIWSVWSHRNNNKVLSGDQMVPPNSDCFSVALYVKLFVLTGGLWILEMISWVHEGPKNPWYYIVTDVLNESQAIWIFIIFVCNLRTLGKLKDRFTNSKDGFNNRMTIIMQSKKRSDSQDTYISSV